MGFVVYFMISEMFRFFGYFLSFDVDKLFMSGFTFVLWVNVCCL